MGKGFKRILLGEAMPDKNDPKYRDRYEREVKAGARFARWCGIDKAAAAVQRFADRHRNIFLFTVFGFTAACLFINIYRLGKIRSLQAEQRSAIEIQDSLIRERRAPSAEKAPKMSNYKPYDAR